MSGPDFSPVAERYVRARPTYPDALFEWLANEAPALDVAWDCATGSGQAAQSLAARFAHVIATDVSRAQLQHAPAHERILYAASSAELAPVASSSISLVTVAAAVHWFDIDGFAREVRRVLRPGGVLAAWTYHVGRAEPPVGPVLGRFYDDVVGSYFHPRARLVDERYEGIHLPGTPLIAPSVFASVCWDLQRTLEFVRTWSGTEVLRRRTGRDPVEDLAPEVAAVWGDAPERELRFPLYLLVNRL